MFEIMINYFLVVDFDLSRREEFIAKNLSLKLGISQTEIFERLLQRKQLGEIKIAKNLELQHIDGSKILESISLFRFVGKSENIYNSLVISLDSQNVGDVFQSILTDLLIDGKYKQLDSVSNEVEFQELLWRRRSV